MISAHDPTLTELDRSLLAGEAGEGVALAMRLVVGTARALGARRLLDITSAHVDGCLYHGDSSLDFVRRLRLGGATTSVPTTLNVGAVDLLHPELSRGAEADAARLLMEEYTALGCLPTYTCAPYQLAIRPRFGDQIAWAESNAIVFANSVIGARTERYGDFTDIAAAVTGRAPAVGLHLDEGRGAGVIVELTFDEELLDEEAVYPILGLAVGRIAGDRVVAIVGLPSDTSEDRLKALGAAAASSGSVALFHAIGVTPEASELSAVASPGTPTVQLDESRLRRAAKTLSTVGPERVDAVCLGTPHYSRDQLETLAAMVAGSTCSVPVYVNTARETLSQLPTSQRRSLEEAGVTVVVDTCTYLTPMLAENVAVVMTDSAKWAYYAPANLGLEVLYGSLEACVRAATGGGIDPW